MIFAKFSVELAKRLISKIEMLSLNPFPSDSKRVINRKEKVFRMRVGDYRIQYIVLDENNLLFITDIDKRENAYN
ncbi:MAG: type II toxin-antitoxin system RelE/ParE family toxin [archaeon]